LQRGGKNGDKYVLARPKLGPIASVPEGTCSATIDDRAIGLEHERKLGMNELLFGHVIEVNGRLERETSSNPDNMRELHVRSFRVVPVVPPRVASAPETPLRFEPEPIAPAPAAPIEEKPVATAGVIQLPNTASSLPAIGLLGMLTMVGGLALHLYRSRERA
jgi:LPXTG-motif cell wall-anchored protein